MKKLLSPWWALITLALIVSVYATNNTFLESVKLRYFDQLIMSKETTENNIYTVNIDEAALEQYGQYPFPRNIYADIIKDIYARGAGIVIWNIMMPEEDRFGGDKALSETMMVMPVILASRPSDKTKNEPINPGASIINPEFMDTLIPYPGITANIPLLEQNAVGSGIVNTEPEIDGVVRRLTTIAVVDGVLYPSLALETLRVIAGDPSFQIKMSPIGVDKMRIPQFGPISTDAEGRVWIDWSQKSKNVSVTAMPEDFGGAVVIVDVTAAGIANPVPTASGSVFPGGVQAAVIGTMFNGSNIERPVWAPSAELAFLAVGGLLLILLSRWVYVGLGTTVLGIAAVIPGSIYLFNTHAMLLDATSGTITFVLVALHAYGIKFVREFLEKQAIKKQFAGYCSPEVVRLLQENPDLIKKGIKKDISVMFSDLRGFTPIGEHYDKPGKGGPAGLTEYMNGYMDAITHPILTHNGMVIKYVGDASMHIQGAPLEDDNHAYNIVETGLQMIDAVEKFSAEKVAQGLPKAEMGFGVNTGEAYIGEMGSTARHNYDVLGDMVSTAARLEARCKAYGVLCIIGEETYNRTKDSFFYLYLDNLQPKGKTESQYIYTALRGMNNKSDIKSKALHDNMHKLYKEKKFDEAIEMCNKLMRHFDGKMEKYYTMWIDRCKEMQHKDLGNDWAGQYVATEK